MSTDTIESEAPDVLPFGGEIPSVEVGGDIDSAIREESAEMADSADDPTITGKASTGPSGETSGDDVGSIAEAPGVAKAGTPDAQDEDGGEAGPLDAATRLALAHLYDVQDRLDAAIGDHESKAEVAKTAKKRVESLQDDLSIAVKKLRNAKAATEPDPQRYPLYDRAKAEVNASFPAPEAIQPLPADSFAEYLRRKQRDTATDQLDLDKRTVKVLVEDLGLKTIGDVVRKWNAVLEAGAKLSTMKGITAPRQEQIATALAEFTDAALAEWNAAHPEDVVTPEGCDDMEIDEALDGNAEEDEIAPDDDE